MPHGPFQHFWDSRKVEVPSLSADSITHILEAVSFSGLRTVHYTGAADEGFLRALVAHQPKLEVSVMDMTNRWGSSTRFFWDEYESSGIEYPECPDWLEDICFYQEGAPDHEIDIRDWPWDSSDQLERIITFTGRKPPKMLVLTGLALMNTCTVSGMFDENSWEDREILRSMPFKHPDFEWQEIGEIWIGRAKMFP
jgi:hypothetical protein